MDVLAGGKKIACFGSIPVRNSMPALSEDDKRVVSAIQRGVYGLYYYVR